MSKKNKDWVISENEYDIKINFTRFLMKTGNAAACDYSTNWLKYVILDTDGSTRSSYVKWDDTFKVGQFTPDSAFSVSRAKR